MYRSGADPEGDHRGLETPPSATSAANEAVLVASKRQPPGKSSDRPRGGVTRSLL